MSAALDRGGYGAGYSKRPARREPFDCADCGVAAGYSQRRTAVDAERGRITVCPPCARARAATRVA